MSVLDPKSISSDRDHLDPEERQLLEQFDALVADDEFERAHGLLEDLWGTAVDAHKPLYQGLANVLAAVCAHQLGHLRGAREIAQWSHELLKPFPRQVLGLDLDCLLDSMERFLERGQGSLQLRPES
jgi:hypothetical protein